VRCGARIDVGLHVRRRTEAEVVVGPGSDRRR
jgi:hypothetical protein